MTSPFEMGLVLATFLLAGFVKGVTGMGLPTVAMGLLSTLMAPAAAAALLIAPSFITNVWQLFAGPSFTTLALRLWPMMAGIFVGTLASGSLLVSGATWTVGALGAVLIVYAAFTLLARQLSVSPRHERWLGPMIGGATGVVIGATGIFVIPAVPYLQALGLAKDELVQALGLSFTVSTIALAISLAVHGGFAGMQSGLLSLVVVASALLGMWLGQVVRKRVSPAAFRKWFLAGLVVLGAELVFRAVAA